MCENSYCVWQKKSDNMFDYAVFFTSHIHRLLSKKEKNKRESEKKKSSPHDWSTDFSLQCKS